MTEELEPELSELTGSADQRLAQLQRIDPRAHSVDWLRRQLTSALIAWGADETKLDIDEEARSDF